MKVFRLLVKLVCIASVVACVSGCVSGGRKFSEGPISRIEFRRVPESTVHVERAVQLASNLYPRICELLLTENAEPPKRFAVIVGAFQKDRPAFATKNRIYLNTRYNLWQDSQEVFDGYMVHEMAHIATGLMQRPKGVKWHESVADYASFKLTKTNWAFCPQCTVWEPTYETGYRCGCAFLLSMESTYGTNLVRELIATLQDYKYSDKFFVEKTGRTLEGLWEDFQLTAAYKPGAREALEIQKALGFKHGQPPRDAVERFRRYVEKTTGRSTKDIYYLQSDTEHPLRPIGTLIYMYLCESLPVGTPYRWLDNLRASGRLPGVAREDHGATSCSPDYDLLASPIFPKSNTMRIRKPGDSSTYSYTMVCDSLNSGWRLSKAWRTGADGKVLEEYQISREESAVGR